MTQMKNNKNIPTMIKVNNNPSTNNIMIKIKSRKKDSNKEPNYKKISLSSKKSIYLVYQKLTKSKNLLFQKKLESYSLIPIKSTDGELDRMLNLDHMSFLT